jgi:hypothetical protein
MFFLQQNWRTRGRNRVCPEAEARGRRRKVAQIIYTHVSTCINNKVKK